MEHRRETFDNGITGNMSCTICLEVTTDILELNCPCHHLICGRCWTNPHLDKNACPHCRNRIDLQTSTPHLLRRIIRDTFEQCTCGCGLLTPKAGLGTHVCAKPTPPTPPTGTGILEVLRRRANGTDLPRGETWPGNSTEFYRRQLDANLNVIEFLRGRADGNIPEYLEWPENSPKYWEDMLQKTLREPNTPAPPIVFYQ
jgi:hypothetical protein